jgi:hypothetical protein
MWELVLEEGVELFDIKRPAAVSVVPDVIK